MARSRDRSAPQAQADPARGRRCAVRRLNPSRNTPTHPPAIGVDYAATTTARSRTARAQRIEIGLTSAAAARVALDERDGQLAALRREIGDRAFADRDGSRLRNRGAGGVRAPSGVVVRDGRLAGPWSADRRGGVRVARASEKQQRTEQQRLHRPPVVHDRCADVVALSGLVTGVVTDRCGRECLCRALPYQKIDMERAA